MGRIFGSQIVTTNYEVTVKKPFDARSLVPSYEDLLLKDNWVKSGTTQVIAYNGMLVSVANTTDVSKNGLYFLFDVNCTTALKSPDVTKEANWIKIGENSDISEFVERLSSIESQLASVEDRLTSLDNRLDAVEASIEEGGASTPSTVTVNKFSELPEIGEENIVYIVEEENATYRWEADTSKYLCIGRETPVIQIICGGNASA